MRYEIIIDGLDNLYQPAGFKIRRPVNDNDIRNKHVIQGHYDGDWG